VRFSLHLLSEERQERSDDDIVAMLAEGRCIHRNEHAARRNHAGPDSSVEFGMAFEQRSVKARGIPIGRWGKYQVVVMGVSLAYGISTIGPAIRWSELPRSWRGDLQKGG